MFEWFSMEFLMEFDGFHRWSFFRRFQWFCQFHGCGMDGFHRCFHGFLTYGSGSKPCTPGEHQNSWKMDVHPTKNGINRYSRYWSIAICFHGFLTYFDCFFDGFTPRRPDLGLDVRANDTGDLVVTKVTWGSPASPRSGWRIFRPTRWLFHQSMGWISWDFHGISMGSHQWFPTSWGSPGIPMSIGWRDDLGNTRCNHH